MIACSRAVCSASLSARRAWIEIGVVDFAPGEVFVALRKESVDRNLRPLKCCLHLGVSLSARRAWIEISLLKASKTGGSGVALRKESVDRNIRNA